MECFATPAIVLKRIPYGDADLIVTFWSLERGKTTLIAKGAKNSRKRFAGVLEPFTVLHILGKPGKGLPLLLEAQALETFPEIRSHVMKTAIASYWAEIVLLWMEADHPQKRVYDLMAAMLQELNRFQGSLELLNMYFQIHFLELCGLGPDFFHCIHCRNEIAANGRPVHGMDLARGGFLCSECAPAPYGSGDLSAQTIRLFQWMRRVDWDRAIRLRVPAASMREGERFLETFLSYHLGREFQSLGVLRQLRQIPAAQSGTGAASGAVSTAGGNRPAKTIPGGCGCPSTSGF
uniref:DNA repair protein RecO n=1 Tax=Desulfatirhabdium butyrativorans TaxID=340467 RepID=A0A7C4MPF1_9BACT